jgi:hypothetical protein
MTIITRGPLRSNVTMREPMSPTAVDADVVGAESRAHAHDVEHFRVQTRDFHEELARGRIEVEREEPIQLPHRRGSILDRPEGLSTSTASLLGLGWDGREGDHACEWQAGANQGLEQRRASGEHGQPPSGAGKTSFSQVRK